MKSLSARGFTTFLITLLLVSQAPLAYAEILNTHTGISAGYSLRQLDSGYTGNAVRVRRNFDDQEQNIGFDGNGDLDASALTTFIPTGLPSTYGNWLFQDAVVPGTFDLGASTRDEVSGIAPTLNAGNEDFFIGGHDSNTGRVFVFDRFGQDQGDIILTGASMTDVEGMSTYLDGGVSKVIVGAFGDNAAGRTTKQLFRFTEPTITGSNITIPNDGSWEQIDFQYPASPLWESGTNRGDVEAMIVDSVGDDKIYIISKREEVNKIFSLPLQSSYSGTQTLTYEGEMHADVVEETGGFISPANAVDATLSQDGLHVLVKTYDKVYQFTRSSTATSLATLMMDTAPVEVPYVGIGSHPSAEPQGESIAFDRNDEGYFTLSETGTGSTATDFPLYYYKKTPTASTTNVSFQEGVSSYAGTQDTWIQQGVDEGVNHGDEVTTINDKNVSDERFTLIKWADIENSIPENATVVSASLDFFIETEGQGFDVHQLFKTWDEDVVTWTNFGGVALDGNDASTDRVGMWPGIDEFTGAVTVTLDTAVVQDWIDTPANNEGLWIIATDDADGQQLSSSEATTPSERPELNITYYTTGGGYVTTWYDQSGDTQDLTQTTTNLQPQLVSSGSVLLQNSLPAIKFDDGDYLENTSLPTPIVAPAHAFTIHNFDNSLADTTQTIYDLSDTVSTTGVGILSIETGPNYNSEVVIDEGGIDTIQDATVSATATTQTSQLLSDTHRFRIDGVESAENALSATTVSGDTLRVGQSLGSTTNGFIGRLQELLFFGSDKSVAEEALEETMSDYWVLSTDPLQLDLDLADGGAIMSSVTITDDTPTALISDAVTPTDNDIEQIKIVVVGIADGAQETLTLDGSTAEALNADFSGSNVTVNTVTGVDYDFTQGTGILLITKNDSGVFTGAEIKLILDNLIYTNLESSEDTDGNRTFAISLIDGIANGGTSTTATVIIDRPAQPESSSRKKSSKRRSVSPFSVVAPVVVTNPSITPPSLTIPSSTDPAVQCPLFTEFYGVGDQGGEISAIQEFLRDQGFFTYPSITGYYGSVTDTAVKGFQAAYTDQILTPWGHSIPTGNWYQTTRHIANKVAGCAVACLVLDNGNTVGCDGGTTPAAQGIEPVVSTLPAQSICTDTFTTNLETGSSGAELTKVQEFLTEQDLLSGDPEATFGPLTQAGVNDFQEEYRAEILDPLLLTNPTGNWYPSTRRQANILVCGQ